MDSKQAKRLEEIGASAERARRELDRVIGQVEALRSAIAEAPVPPVPDPSPPAPVPDPGPPPIPDSDPVPTPPIIPEPSPPPIPEPTPPPVPEPSPPGPELVPDPPATEPPPVVAEAPTPNGDAAARLVAMKMAIDGSPRETIDGELAARFGSADRVALLDEVLARAGR